MVNENLPCLCRTCRRIGHYSNNCNISKKVVEAITPQITNAMETGNAKGEEEESTADWLLEKAKKKEYDEWMVVTRRKKPQSPGLGRNLNEARQAGTNRTINQVHQTNHDKGKGHVSDLLVEPNVSKSTHGGRVLHYKKSGL